MALSTDLQQLKNKAEKEEEYYSDLQMVASWVVATHLNPKDAPQTVEYQIEQLGHVLDRRFQYLD